MFQKFLVALGDNPANSCSLGEVVRPQRLSKERSGAWWQRGNLWELESTRLWDGSND